jgi:VWFA-related protein
MRAVALALTALVAAAAWPGEARQQPQPTFRGGVDIVQVDVSVLDRDRLPVAGLSQSDFTILENGKPQEIVAFAPVDVPGPEPPAATWIRDIAPDVRSNALGDGRLFAIILDDATMPPDLRMTVNAKTIGRDVIARLGTSDLAAVIYTSNSRHSVDFTHDRTRLLAAIEAFTPGFAYNDPSTDRYHFQASIRTLAQTSAYLASVPQRRKAVIYVSTGVPLDTRVVAAVTLVEPSSQGGNVLDIDLNDDLYAAMNELLEERPQEAYGLALQDALIRAQDGNVNVYCVDPGGLGGMQQFLQSRTTIQQLDAMTRAGRGAPPVRTDPLEALVQARLNRDFLEVVAVNSGGRAILNTSDFNAGLTQIFRENSSYYLIGYRSTTGREDRKLRRVTVRMHKPGLTARTRNAYFTPRQRRAAAAPGPLRLTEALFGILPNPEITLRVSATPFALPSRTEAGLAIVLGVRHPPLPGDVGARASGTLDVLTSAFAPDGRQRGSVKQIARVIGRAGSEVQAEYEVLSRLDLPPGRYQIRVAAHSPALDRTGSVYTDVEIPDFRRDTLSLSGIVLSATPSLAAAPADALSTMVPVVPTSQRTFGSQADVIAFVEVYHGRRAPSAPLPITVTIADDADRRVFSVSESLAPDRFNQQHTAPFQFQLPLDRLGAGRYMLTIEVPQGAKPPRRHVRFDVQ